MLIVLTSLVLSAWFAWEAAGWLEQYLHEEMLYNGLMDCLQRAAILEAITNVNPMNTPLFSFSRPFLEDIMDVNWTYSSTALAPTFQSTALAPPLQPTWVCNCPKYHEGVAKCDICGVIQPRF